MQDKEKNGDGEVLTTEKKFKDPYKSKKQIRPRIFPSKILNSQFL